MQVHEILRWVITPQILETISARRVILGVRGAQVALKCTPPRMAYKVQRSGRLSGFWLELVRHNFFCSPGTSGNYSYPGNDLIHHRTKFWFGKELFSTNNDFPAKHVLHAVETSMLK